MEQAELETKLAALGDLTEEQRNSVVCSLIGHSKIQSTFMGYYYCGRCGDQVGDALGSVYDSTKVVIVAHNCDKCRENYDALGWQDKYLAPDPFAEWPA